MPWGRLDDRANGNAKLLALSDAAWRMWGCALIYCQANLTDGFVPAHALDTFGVRARNKKAVAEELCRPLVPGKGPCWHKVAGGYLFHDYLDWNDSREKILHERAIAEARKKRFEDRRKNGVPNASENGAAERPERTSTTTSTTTEGFTDLKPSTRGRVFDGKRLKVSRRQHEFLTSELGTMAGHLDLLALYETWDAQLELSGADFDTLEYLKNGIAGEVRILRAGGSLFRGEPEGEDWFSECQRLHGRSCNGQSGHALQMVLDADRAQRKAAS